MVQTGGLEILEDLLNGGDEVDGREMSEIESTARVEEEESTDSTIRAETGKVGRLGDVVAKGNKCS